MPSITIKIELPEGATVQVEADDGRASNPPSTSDQVETRPADEDIERYWRDYLSDNGRRLYAAAAAQERQHGPGYTLSLIASAMDESYDTVRSLHRTSGRSAKRWREEQGSDEPIKLLDKGRYDWIPEEGGMRTKYELPEGVAAVIERL